VDSLPPQNRNEFEAAADRAREKARSLVAEGIAEQAESERQADSSATRRGPVMTLVDRVRSAWSAAPGR
jgi:hypothetical protein